MTCDTLTEPLRKQWGNGIPYLSGLGIQAPGEYKISRERLETGRLAHTNRTVLLRMAEPTVRVADAPRCHCRRRHIPSQTTVNVRVSGETELMAVRHQLVRQVSPTSARRSSSNPLQVDRRKPRCSMIWHMGMRFSGRNCRESRNPVSDGSEFGVLRTGTVSPVGEDDRTYAACQ